MTELEKLISRRRTLKAQLERTEYDLKQVNDELFALVQGQEDEKISANDEEYRIVRGESTEYNWKGLEEELGESFMLVLEPNVKALEEAVERGLISPSAVAKYSSKTPRKPYVRAFQK